MTEVILVTMPFGPINTPSLGLSLLRSGLENESIQTEIKYYNIEFAKKIDLVDYIRISNGFPVNHDLLGEWLFSTYLFNKSESDINSYFNEVILGTNPSHKKERFNIDEISPNYLNALRKIIISIPDFISFCLEDILKAKPKIVGFTSVFQQHIASLCLAREIKKQSPDTKIVFGGANVESIMGIENIRQFSFIDFVVSGEGDKVFPELTKKILEGNKEITVPGVFDINCIEKQQRMSTETINNLDEIPIPNYDDYFSEIKSVDYSKYFNLRLLFESSRGCWWGERHHCTFCGLNGETMKHRSKSFQRVISELEEFESKYSGHTISVVDNILDMGYFKDLIPELKSNNKKYDLFYEVKANLKKEQISALSDVGIRMIQPGIESLSSEVLKEMNKGVSALQNIQLMKWSKEAGVLPIWNFLWGFPKERPEEYKKMNTIADKIFHLSPPKSYATIRIDRFSPNHSEYKKMGYDEIYPYPSYKYVYSSLSDDTINNLAYFFDYKSPNKENVPVYTKELSLKIKEWNIAFDESELFYVNIQDVMLVCDTRSNRPTQIYTISKLCSKIIELTDRAIPINEITHKLQSETNTNSHDINNALQYLCSKDLIIEDETKVLSLVVKLNDRYKPNVKSLKKMYEWLEQNATLDSQDNFIISHSQIGLTPQPS